MVLKFIVGLLNSKLLSFYAREKNIILVKPGKTPQIRSGQKGPIGVRQLPIKNSQNEQNTIVKNVDRILEITKTSDFSNDSIKQAKVKECEREIDQMVYELYGLTKEEIEVVENSSS